MKLTVALLSILLSIPAAYGRDGAVDPLRGAQRGANPQDTLLAALGEATVACLGKVSTGDYRVTSTVNSARVLERNFDTCTSRDTRALEQIDRLLGVQHSREGREDGLAERYSLVWSKAERAFPHRLIQQCPDWELLHVIDAPTPERVAYFASQEGAAGIGKEYHWYTVSSPQCGSNGFCAVFQAMLCGAGFSNQFIVWTDPFSSSVIVDPAWWLTTYEYESDAENPFWTAPGAPYEHSMSYYGDDVPGALYGSVMREGETCTRWSEIAQKHYTDSTLKKIDCGGGWFCMTMCK